MTGAAAHITAAQPMLQPRWIRVCYKPGCDRLIQLHHVSSAAMGGPLSAKRHHMIHAARAVPRHVAGRHARGSAVASASRQAQDTKIIGLPVLSTGHGLGAHIHAVAAQSRCPSAERSAGIGKRAAAGLREWRGAARVFGFFKRVPSCQPQMVAFVRWRAAGARRPGVRGARGAAVCRGRPLGCARA